MMRSERPRAWSEATGGTPGRSAATRRRVSPPAESGAVGMSTPRLLEIDDLDPGRLMTMLDRAESWKRDPASIPAVLSPGPGAALLFEKPSARTRVSIEMAIATLGGHPIYVRGEEVGIGTRESVEDVARTLASYCAVIAARVFDHTVLEGFAPRPPSRS